MAAILNLYQGETFSIGVTSESITLADATVAVALYKDGRHVLTFEDIETSLTIPASDTAKLCPGRYNIEVKCLYEGRLYTSKTVGCLDIMNAETRDLMVDDEDPEENDNAIEVNIEAEANEITIVVQKGQNTGGSTVVVTNSDSNTTSIKVDGVDKVTDLARKGYVDSAVSGKADTSALAAYQKLPDIVQSADIEVIDGYKTILVEEQSKTTFYEVGEVTNMTIYVADNIAQEVIVSFSIVLDSEGSCDIALEGDYDIVGELPEWETDVRYVVSILDGLVVFGTATHVSSTSNEEE